MADQDGWVSDEDLEAAKKIDHIVYGPTDPSSSGANSSSRQQRSKISGAFARTQAARIFEENAASAAMSIAKIAKHGTNEAARLKASQYIIDRVMGKIPDANAHNGANAQPLEAMLQGLQDAEDDEATMSISVTVGHGDDEDYEDREA